MWKYYMNGVLYADDLADDDVRRILVARGNPLPVVFTQNLREYNLPNNGKLRFISFD